MIRDGTRRERGQHVMALPVRQQLTWWGLAAVGFLALLWLLGGVVLPFVIAMAVAYLLDPVADRLQRHGFSRVWATVAITAAAALVFAAMIFLVAPLLVSQTLALINTAPAIAERLQGWAGERFPAILDGDSTVRQWLAEMARAVQSKGGTLVRGVVASAMTLVNMVAVLVVVPVITFYLLLDWDRMMRELSALLPRDHAPMIRRLAGEIDATLASFVRGQGTVCLLIGIYYAVALMAVGLDFGLVVGLVGGLLSFIPFVGALLGGALAVGLGLFQFWGDWLPVIAIAVIFAVGQVIEGNILTPRLVGGSVGLHPVWLIFSLSAFGAVFGFVGMLLAVPIAASIGVLTRFAIERYRQSRLYLGRDWRELQADDAERGE